MLATEIEPGIFINCWDPEMATHRWEGPERGFVPTAAITNPEARRNLDLYKQGCRRKLNTGAHCMTFARKENP